MNQRFVVHFTPTHASWMNLVEVWFGIVEGRAIPRAVVKSVKDLNAKIRAFIGVRNDRGHPFVWVKTGEQISRERQPSNHFKSAALARVRSSDVTCSA